MVNVELTQSILDSMKLGYKLPKQSLLDIGMETEEMFNDTYLKDIETMAEYPEEPEEIEYKNPKFKVLHTVVGELESDDGMTVGRLTYHLVDIGFTDKVLGIILDLDVVPTESDYIEEYRLEYSYVTILNRDSYTDYLLVVEEESEIS